MAENIFVHRQCAQIAGHAYLINWAIFVGARYDVPLQLFMTLRLLHLHCEDRVGCQVNTTSRNLDGCEEIIRQILEVIHALFYCFGGSNWQRHGDHAGTRLTFQQFQCNAHRHGDHTRGLTNRNTNQALILHRSQRLAEAILALASYRHEWILRVFESLKNARGTALNPDPIDLRLSSQEVGHDRLSLTAVPLTVEFGQNLDVGTLAEGFLCAFGAISVYTGTGDAIHHHNVTFATHAFHQVFGHDATKLNLILVDQYGFRCSHDIIKRDYDHTSISGTLDNCIECFGSRSVNDNGIYALCNHVIHLGDLRFNIYAGANDC